MNKLYDRYENFNSMSRTELQTAVQVLSKTANTRLRSIEKANLTKASNAYRYVETKAYDKARFISTTKNNEIKFKTTTRGRTTNELREEVAELRDFLFKAKTSTVSGINERYQKAYDTWKENNPDMNMSKDEFGEMWSQSNMKKLVNMYGSDVAIDIMSGKDYENISMDEINQLIGNVKEDTPYSDLTSQLSILDESDIFDVEDLPF